MNYEINVPVYSYLANDNGHGIMASIYAIKALKESGIKMKYNLGIALVADEEVGSCKES